MKTESCWLWTAHAVIGSGYGQFRNPANPGGYAHRFSWVVHNGPIPVGMCVCHDCPGGDNRLCVNPSHLWLGTNKDNSLDMATKGRSTFGVRHPMVKLAEADVLEIRRLCAAGAVQSDVAKLFGVGNTQVSRIVRRLLWRHLP